MDGHEHADVDRRRLSRLRLRMVSRREDSGELAEGLLKPLPLRDGRERLVQIYLIFTDRDAAGPGTLRLAQIIREAVAPMEFRSSPPR